MRWLQAVPLTFLTKHTTLLSLMVGVNLLTNRQHQVVNFLLSETGCSSATAMRLLPPPLIVVSALLGGCNTTGSLPSTGSSEPGADEEAEPASTLLQVTDPATPLLVALGFPSKPLNVLLDHAERGVGRCGGRCMGSCGGVSLSIINTSYQKLPFGSGDYPDKLLFHQALSLCPHVHKEVLPKRNPKNQKEQRTKNEHEREAGSFWAVSSVRGIFWAVSSISGTFWAISSVGGTFWAVSSIGGTF